MSGLTGEEDQIVSEYSKEPRNGTENFQPNSWCWGKEKQRTVCHFLERQLPLVVTEGAGER